MDISSDSDLRWEDGLILARMTLHGECHRMEGKPSPAAPADMDVEVSGTGFHALGWKVRHCKNTGMDTEHTALQPFPLCP